MIDDRGRQWRAWNVQAPVPYLLADVPHATLVREQYRNGWLAYECLDTGERYRLAPAPSGWEELADEQLLALKDLGEPIEPRNRLIE